MTIEAKIKQQLSSSPIVLYMKGTPDAPQCGFSGRAVQILQACHADFTAINVLADPDVREGIKRYGNWPTIPQLYINGELIGGSDIMAEMFANGELQKLLATAKS
ncbi:MAG: Grx4 family monothiol glutaredoxin [Coxiellaceae bacterium]|nr:MAG: Grx4 family monothiol glutaredoxin [Coxiellaceae bacterium]